MRISHKRHANDRDITFSPPAPDCFACYDSGIISNGDGLLNSFIPDYDLTRSNELNGGQDLAIICWCKSVFAQYGPDGNQTAGAYRSSSGDPILISTSTGQQPIGTSISKEAARQIHDQRRQSWQQTAATMNKLRQQALSGNRPDLPPFMQDIKHQLANPSDILPSF